VNKALFEDLHKVMMMMMMVRSNFLDFFQRFLRTKKMSKKKDSKKNVKKTPKKKIFPNCLCGTFF